MSRITKQKYVYKEIEQQLPTPTESNYIVQVIGNRGNYLYEVKSPDSTKFLVTMPVKFRRTAYVCRGNFVMVENIPEGKKVKAEITHILMPEDVRYIHSNQQWPDQFMDVYYLRKDKGNNEMISEDLLPSINSDEDDEDHEDDETYNCINLNQCKYMQ